MNFHNRLIFYGEELLTPRPNPKLEDHPLSVVREIVLYHRQEVPDVTQSLSNVRIISKQ
jgi:hypothetical protein